MESTELKGTVPVVALFLRGASRRADVLCVLAIDVPGGWRMRGNTLTSAVYCRVGTEGE